MRTPHGFPAAQKPDEGDRQQDDRKEEELTKHGELGNLTKQKGRKGRCPLRPFRSFKNLGALEVTDFPVLVVTAV